MLQKIEIDLAINKLIEAERQSFEEPPYIVLRRLLNIPVHEQPTLKDNQAVVVAPTGKSWSDSGVTIPHGTLARMEYDRGKQKFEGQFLDGYLVVNGKKYQSLSNAASNLAKTKSGEYTALNGWLYWSVQLPGEDRWRKLNDMR